MWPNEKGYFGNFGGRFVPETLITPLKELEGSYQRIIRDPSFQRELHFYLEKYAGRPTALYPASRLSQLIDGAKIYLKREDLCHTGAHKINNTIGQSLLAKRMGKKRIIAETGAGQHGVATATAAALFGMPCDIYMGREDMKRQSLNVFKMRILGARVIEVTSGSETLKDAINETLRDWATNIKDTYYVLGSVVGPHPYPLIIRDFQRIIGLETKEQCYRMEKSLPDFLVACVGGGSNSLGLFHPFLEEPDVYMIGVEAGGSGEGAGMHGASLTLGDVGIFHGCKSYILQDTDGQIIPAHSISAGLDYPGVGPEHCYLKETGRVEYVKVMDDDAVMAFHELTRTEGIIPALESAHAVGYVLKNRDRFERGKNVVICLSGRGDKDLGIIAEQENENPKT